MRKVHSGRMHPYLASGDPVRAQKPLLHSVLVQKPRVFVLQLRALQATRRFQPNVIDFDTVLSCSCFTCHPPLPKIVNILILTDFPSINFLKFPHSLFWIHLKNILPTKKHTETQASPQTVHAFYQSYTPSYGLRFMGFEYVSTYT